MSVNFPDRTFERGRDLLRRVIRMWFAPVGSSDTSWLASRLMPQNLGVADTGPTEEETPDGLLGWCLVANVARETAHGESGLDIQRGTKHFPVGALLWIPPVRWDPGHCRWPAVGRHRRNSRRYINIVVRAQDLENFRVKGVYSEGLVRSLNGHLHDPATPRTLQNPWTRERAQEWADGWNQPREPIRIDGHSHPWISVPNPPPAELQVDGETLHLAHYGTRGAHYSRTPPPMEGNLEP